MRIPADPHFESNWMLFLCPGMIETFRFRIRQMVEADLMGIDSHGIGQLPLYEQFR